MSAPEGGDDEAKRARDRVASQSITVLFASLGYSTHDAARVLLGVLGLFAMGSEHPRAAAAELAEALCDLVDHLGGAPKDKPS